MSNQEEFDEELKFCKSAEDELIHAVERLTNQLDPINYPISLDSQQSILVDMWLDYADISAFYLLTLNRQNGLQSKYDRRNYWENKDYWSIEVQTVQQELRCYTNELRKILPESADQYLKKGKCNCGANYPAQSYLFNDLRKTVDGLSRYVFDENDANNI